MTQYRVIGRFAKDTKPHVVVGGAFAPNLTKEDAEKAIRDILRKQELAKQRGEYSDGLVSTPYYSDYELVDLKIQTREVTPWV